MSNPKFIAESENGLCWFECPFCFELFEAIKGRIKGYGGTTASCGCRRAGDAYKPSKEQQATIAWLKKQIKGEKDDLPPILKKLKGQRRIAYEWNTDANTQAADNFIRDIGDRPSSKHIVGWKDPFGDISPENFEWKNTNADKSRTDRTTDSD